MKLTKPFLGVPDGEIYPRQYQPGDTCPPELEAAATALGAAEPAEPEDSALEPADEPAPVEQPMAAELPEPPSAAPASRTRTKK